MKRRRLAFGAVAAVAGLAGAGGAWWQWRRAESARAAAQALTASFWSWRFEQPAGGELVLANFRGAPLLVNFWATWCQPCVTEMPLLDRFQARHQARGWQVVGLAVDSVAPVRDFLARQPMRFAIGMAGFGGVELARTLGNGRGGLPFSVVFDRQGNPARTKLGPLEDQDLADWVNQLS